MRSENIVGRVGEREEEASDILVSVHQPCTSAARIPSLSSLIEQTQSMYNRQKQSGAFRRLRVSTHTYWITAAEANSCLSLSTCTSTFRFSRFRCRFTFPSLLCPPSFFLVSLSKELLSGFRQKLYYFSPPLLFFHLLFLCFYFGAFT